MYFVTSNKGKLKEFQEILKIEIDKIDLDLPEIQSIEVEEVAREKVLFAYEKIKKPVFIEDSGLYFEGLNGLPGALIKLFLKKLSLEQICDLLEENRKAVAKTCLAYSPDGKEVHLFNGIVKGKIVEQPIGNNGFGWDPIFIPDGETHTFAEISSEKKNLISMRNIACFKFKEYLKNN